jgi:hypothetical protein
MCVELNALLLMFVIPIKKDIISNQTLTKWRITTSPKHHLIEKHYIVTVDNQIKSSTNYRRLV